MNVRRVGESAETSAIEQTLFLGEGCGVRSAANTLTPAIPIPTFSIIVGFFAFAAALIVQMPFPHLGQMFHPGSSFAPQFPQEDGAIVPR
jgi:hypothetical protein